MITTYNTKTQSSLKLQKDNIGGNVHVYNNYFVSLYLHVRILDE